MGGTTNRIKEIISNIVVNDSGSLSPEIVNCSWESFNHLDTKPRKKMMFL